MLRSFYYESRLGTITYSVYGRLFQRAFAQNTFEAAIPTDSGSTYYKYFRSIEENTTGNYNSSTYLARRPKR